MSDEGILTNTLDGLRNTNDTLRASIGRVEKRNEELELALEVARREASTAKFAMNNWMETAENYATHCGAACEQLEQAEADRDAALAQMAGLREALEKVKKFAGNWTTQDLIYHIMRDALATPGPCLGEIKAEALERLAEGNDEAISQMTSPRASAQVLRAEAARLRGGAA